MCEVGNYQCGLDAHSLQKATRELNEDPRERLGTLRTLREWAEQQPWLKTPTGKFVYFDFTLFLSSPLEESSIHVCPSILARCLCVRPWVT